MNIAIVYQYDFYKNEWSTPKGIEQGFINSNNKVDSFYLDTKTCNFDALIEYKTKQNYLSDPLNYNFFSLKDTANQYDLILFFYAGASKRFDSELQSLKNNTKTKLFLELGDEPQTFLHNQQRINFVDAIFTPDLRCHDIYKSKGYNSFWMTHWCDESIFYYNKDVPRENICLTTCGDRPPYTNILPKFLNKKFLNKRIQNEENNAFYNSGTVVFQYARWDEITRRIFEGGGCKNAVITNRISKETGIYDLFKEDEDICYYSNETECISKINKLLHDEEYRNKLANNLYKKVTENHLVKNRIDLILEALRK
jgi:hypothetical protein